MNTVLPFTPFGTFEIGLCLGAGFTIAQLLISGAFAFLGKKPTP